MHNKAQAAMEFLLNYGWAIMVVVIVISASAYFGFLSPSNFAPERCAVTLPFNCDGGTAGEDVAGIALENVGGRDLTVKSVTFTSEALLGECTANVNIQIKNGEEQTIYADDPVGCSHVGGKGKNKYAVKITYFYAGSGIDQQMVGEMVAKFGGAVSGGVGGGVTGAVAHWAFDDLSNGRIIIDSAGSYDGTFFSSVNLDATLGDGTCAAGAGSCPASLAGQAGYGNALSFDGVNDAVRATIAGTKTTYAYRADDGSGWKHYATAGATQYVNGNPQAYTNVHYMVNGNDVAIGGPILEPDDVSGLQLWLRADAGITKTGVNRVTLWEDQTTAGTYDVAPPNVGAEPLWVDNYVNGKPAIYFDGNDHLWSSVNFPAGDKTIIVVAKSASGPDRAMLSTDPDDPIDGWALYRWNNGNKWAVRAYGVGGDAFAPDNSVNTNWHIFTGKVDDYVSAGDDGEIRLYVDAVSVATDAALTEPTKPNTLYVGSRDDWSHFWTGHIAEIAIYNKLLSDSERRAVESYVGAKYAIPVTGGFSHFPGEIDEFRVYGTALSQSQVQQDMNKYPLKDVVASYSFEHLSGTGPTKATDTRFIVQGQKGGALQLKSANSEYVMLGDVLDFPGTSPYSLSLWANPSSGNPSYARLLAKDDEAAVRDGYAVLLSNDATKYRFERWAGGAGTGKDSVTAATAGVWASAIGTYDANNIRLFINGNQEAAGPSTGSMEDTSASLRIGRSASTYFSGLIDEVVIYDRALTDAEAQALGS
ncbi:hypothetical protein HYX10_03000 [Candidatus Woesearchaeota archaeon]|nr:hypothetical protein [Candidatus Woesearchaeota archaeon]